MSPTLTAVSHKNHMVTNIQIVSGLATVVVAALNKNPARMKTYHLACVCFCPRARTVIILITTIILMQKTKQKDKKRRGSSRQTYILFTKVTSTHGWRRSHPSVVASLDNQNSHRAKKTTTSEQPPIEPVELDVAWYVFEAGTGPKPVIPHAP